MSDNRAMLCFFISFSISFSILLLLTTGDPDIIDMIIKILDKFAMTI